MIYFYEIKARPRDNSDITWLTFIHATDTPTNLYLEQRRVDKALDNTIQVISCKRITELEAIKVLTGIVARHKPISAN